MPCRRRLADAARLVAGEVVINERGGATLHALDVAADGRARRRHDGHGQACGMAERKRGRQSAAEQADLRRAVARGDDLDLRQRRDGRPGAAQPVLDEVLGRPAAKPPVVASLRYAERRTDGALLRAEPVVTRWNVGGSAEAEEEARARRPWRGPVVPSAQPDGHATTPRSGASAAALATSGSGMVR
jgi:hypothetical protein